MEKRPLHGKIIVQAHWRHGHKKYLGLTLKPIPRDIRNTF